MLHPLAAAPGLALAQIYAEVAAAGESMGTGLVIAFLAVGPLIAIASGRRVEAPRPAGPTGRGLLSGADGVGAPAYFWANFGPGIALADMYLIGGDHSLWAVPLYATSGLAAAALAGQVAWNRSRR